MFRQLHHQTKNRMLLSSRPKTKLPLLCHSEMQKESMIDYWKTMLLSVPVGVSRSMDLWTGTIAVISLMTSKYGRRSLEERLVSRQATLQRFKLHFLRLFQVKAEEFNVRRSQEEYPWRH